MLIGAAAAAASSQKKFFCVTSASCIGPHAQPGRLLFKCELLQTVKRLNNSSTFWETPSSLDKFSLVSPHRRFHADPLTCFMLCVFALRQASDRLR